MFLEEYAQTAGRMNEEMLVETGDVVITNYYDLLSIAKYEVQDFPVFTANSFCRIYKWILPLKCGFDLVYEVEESKDGQTSLRDEITNIQIIVYLKKDDSTILRENDINKFSDEDRVALESVSQKLDAICADSLTRFHRKMDSFNERQKQQDVEENQKLFEKLMQTEEFRELLPLTEQYVVKDGKMYVYPETYMDVVEHGANV
jgi:hypothetical protein